MKILSFITFICQEVKNFLFGKKRKSKKQFYIVEYASDFPDEPVAPILYVLGKPGDTWLAGMNCPCGCGEFIELVLDGQSPNWHLSMSEDAKPSLSPSVHRSVNCRSHFFLRKGKIQWCKS